MQAVWLDLRQQISVRDIPAPRKPGEALIRIRKAGICSTDLELVRGYYPYAGVLGHEFVGEVMDAPDKSWIGQRVVARHALQQNLLSARGIRLMTEDEIQPRKWDVVVEATGSPLGFELARGPFVRAGRWF